MAPGAVRFDLFELGTAVPDLAHAHRSGQLDLIAGSGQRMQPARDVRFPDAEIEIEVMGAVARAGSRRGCRIGSAHRQRYHDDAERREQCAQA